MINKDNVAYLISFWEKVIKGEVTPCKNDIQHTIWFIEDLQRLNATAQPVSGGRTMREHEFSQLVNELRDVPAIQSKREKIVGILKAFNIRPAAPGGQDD